MQSRTAPRTTHAAYMNSRRSLSTIAFQFSHRALLCFASDPPSTMGQEKKSDVIVTVRPVRPRTMSGDSSTLQKFRDGADETMSQISSATSLKDVEAGKSMPASCRCSRSSPLRRWFGAARTSNTNKRQLWCRWVLIAFVVLGFFGVIATM
jgi:hypothetical protein